MTLLDNYKGLSSLRRCVVTSFTVYIAGRGAPTEHKIYNKNPPFGQAAM